MKAMLSPPRRDAILLVLSLCIRRNVTALSTMRLSGLMAAAHPVVPLGQLLVGRSGWQACCDVAPDQFLETLHDDWCKGHRPVVVKAADSSLLW